MENLQKYGDAIAIAAMVVLGGRVSPETQRVRQEYAQRFQAESSQCREKQNDSKFAAIKSKLAETEPTIAQLADPRRPTPAERSLLLEWGTLSNECRGKTLAALSAQGTSTIVLGVPWERYQIAIAKLARRNNAEERADWQADIPMLIKKLAA